MDVCGVGEGKSHSKNDFLGLIGDRGGSRGMTSTFKICAERDSKGNNSGGGMPGSRQQVC